MKTIIISLKIFLFFTVLTGIIYPLFVTGISQLLFPAKANGSLIVKDNQTIGSKLIGQQFDSIIYFTSRPSAIAYNPLPSGGSNYGLTNVRLKTLVNTRKKQFLAFNQLDSLGFVPSEMLFASASGLDPHTSPDAALLQVDRIAKARHFDNNQKEKLLQTVKDMTEMPQLLILGEERINVLMLNIELNKIGMIFLFIIILVLSVFSGYYINKLSNKTSAILKENYLSVVYAREMSEGMININHEITTSFLTKINADSLRILKELNFITKALSLEKNNITEPGEDKLVSGIETDYSEYRDSVIKFIKSPASISLMVFLENKSGILDQQLLVLSQMNGKALEVKTDDAKASSKSVLTRMTVLATICFLIGMSFTFSFASYFNRRFFQLYNGIKAIVSSNFEQRLYFDGKDEFYEISLVFNEMADIIKTYKQKMSVNLQEDKVKDSNSIEVQELKKMLFKIKSMEEEAVSLISRIEKK
jgi:K+-transporting ATPase ATPase C chain